MDLTEQIKGSSLDLTCFINITLDLVIFFHDSIWI